MKTKKPKKDYYVTKKDRKSRAIAQRAHLEVIFDTWDGCQGEIL